MSCDICPRACAAAPGVCGFFGGEYVPVAKTMLHFWEEPPISGSCGTGAIFIAGCNLRCVFCQNFLISHNPAAYQACGTDDLVKIFFSLAEQGAHNISLITGGHRTPQIARAIRKAKQNGFALPFVWNSSAYERAESLRELSGLIDVYLPDYKFFSDEIAGLYAGVADYTAVAAAAIKEMYAQAGESPALFDADGLLIRGIIIRHLVLPGQRKAASDIIRHVSAAFPNAYISLMRQYCPAGRVSRAAFPELNRKITSFEYDGVVKTCLELGVESRVFTQGAESAAPGFTPEF